MLTPVSVIGVMEAYEGARFCGGGMENAEKIGFCRFFGGIWSLQERKNLL
jgi:hypothetical protein